MTRGQLARAAAGALALVGIATGLGTTPRAPVAGCSNDLAEASSSPPARVVDPCDSPTPPELCAAAAGGAAAICRSGAPDGRCDRAEDCMCEDCASTSRCTERCVDDGTCDRDAGEDCTCADCDGRVEGCAPQGVGCVDDGFCSQITDDCTCADCSLDRGCQGCDHNGFCNVYVEGCACDDCASQASCQGGAGGAGGAGGGGGGGAAGGG